ncbi:OLC1v1022275C3 [Oldenlandia corymbosa var. corymbosa]|uniref:OLC1v1022275C3 n=1 Tax=Oldenlandia corymbosa var. corymbosa TaxID=529605 RepID=A0AAV1C038_OLDCO|nr:OLC1v1022275C3 [Oldenlandia corymbosa var. corymbosa]
MASNGVPALGRVNLADLMPCEGIPSDAYKLSVSTLSQSLVQYSAAIIQFPGSDAALLRSCLDSARLYFQQKPAYPCSADIIHNQDDTRDWCKSSGYRADTQLWQEVYDFRPGLTPIEPNNDGIIELPPSGLVDVFSLLGKAARDVLDAVSFYLNLRSNPFTEILDNVPLRNREISSSVLSVCCHARPSFQGAHEHHNSLTTTQDDSGQLVMFSDNQEHHHEVDRSLVTIVKSDRAGLRIRDFQGQWVLVDGDLGPQEAVLYPGLALYQATAGYVSPAMHRPDNTGIVQDSNMYGRCSVAFKLMPKSTTNLNCSEMRAAGHGVEAQFQLPVPVDDFMQRSTDQLLSRNNFPTFNYPTSQDGSLKPMVKKKKNSSRSKPLPPSKRLRLEAQRVLKERVQDIADKKGIKLRFCLLKECENHIHSLDSPCASLRMELGWPQGVPFVHPHDLPNKAKIGFLETYEPGWSSSQDMELNLVEPGQQSSHQHHPANCSCKFHLNSTIRISIMLLVL